MGKQRSVEYAELAEQIKLVMPLHHTQVAILFNLKPKTAAYIIRHFIGTEHAAKEQPKDLKGSFWGQSADDYFIEPR